MSFAIIVAALIQARVMPVCMIAASNMTLLDHIKLWFGVAHLPAGPVSPRLGRYMSDACLLLGIPTPPILDLTTWYVQGHRLDDELAWGRLWPAAKAGELPIAHAGGRLQPLHAWCRRRCR